MTVVELIKVLETFEGDLPIILTWEGQRIPLSQGSLSEAEVGQVKELQIFCEVIP